MDLVEVADGVHLLPLTGSNAYLVRDEEGVVLVDAGPLGSGPTIRAALAHLGIRPDELRAIVLTHCHDDHAGGASDVAVATGASVVVGRGDADVVRGLEPESPIDFTEAERALHAVVAADLPSAPPCPVQREVGEGDRIGAGIHVLAVPGHTSGSIALHLPGRGVLLTGDTVAEHAGGLVLGPFNVDRATAWSSLQRLAGVEAEVAVFGHGQPITSGLTDAFDRASDPFG